MISAGGAGVAWYPLSAHRILDGNINDHGGRAVCVPFVLFRVLEVKRGLRGSGGKDR